MKPSVPSKPRACSASGLFGLRPPQSYAVIMGSFPRVADFGRPVEIIGSGRSSSRPLGPNRMG